MGLRDKDFAEKVLTERIEKFSQCFFSIPIAQRQKIWTQLERRVRPFPQLAWRLNRLKSGLTIGVPLPNEFSHSMDLAQYQCEAFVMSPTAAGNSLRNRVSEISVGDGRLKDTKKALDQLFREYPDVAVLRPTGVLPFADRVKRSLAKPKPNPQPLSDRHFGIVPSMGILGMAIALLFLFLNYGMPLLRTIQSTESKSPWEEHELRMDAVFRDLNADMQKSQADFARDHARRREEAKQQREKLRESAREMQSRLMDSRRPSQHVYERPSGIDIRTIVREAQEQNDFLSPPDISGRSNKPSETEANDITEERRTSSGRAEERQP